MTKFVPRTKAPTKNDLYFVRKSAGGYSQCIAGKPLFFAGSVLSNCVGYAWGRAAELEGTPKCSIGVPTSRLKAGSYAPTDAYLWMNYANGRKTGKTPKLGAVAVWKRTDKVRGHVAVVSEVYPDGSWLSEESAYGGTTFVRRKYSKTSYRANNKFLGFIYLNVTFDDDEPTLKKGDKIQIISKGNARKDGKGKTSYGIGYKRYILDYYPGQPYPYRVGNRLGVTTGYYAEKALKKI